MPVPVIDNEHDRGEVAALVRSRGWGFYEQVMRAMIAELTESLISKNDEELRGRIKGLREALRTPSDMMAKAKLVIDKERGNE